MIQKRTIGVLAFLFIVQLLSGQEPHWQLKLDKEGIAVYTAKSGPSDLETFKGITTVESTLSAIVALLQDIAHYPDWMYKTGEARLLKSEGAILYIYTLSEAPWPIKSRDNVNFCRLVQNPDNKEILITLKAVPDYLPRNNEYIRIPEADGFWRLTPDGKGKVQVTYQMKTESGGSLPAWMANLAITEAPFQILKKLREEIKKPLYKNAIVKGIAEK